MRVKIVSYLYSFSPEKLLICLSHKTGRAGLMEQRREKNKEAEIERSRNLLKFAEEARGADFLHVSIAGHRL